MYRACTAVYRTRTPMRGPRAPPYYRRRGHAGHLVGHRRAPPQPSLYPAALEGAVPIPPALDSFPHRAHRKIPTRSKDLRGPSLAASKRCSACPSRHWWPPPTRRWWAPPPHRRGRAPRCRAPRAARPSDARRSMHNARNDRRQRLARKAAQATLGTDARQLTLDELQARAEAAYQERVQRISNAWRTR